MGGNKIEAGIDHRFHCSGRDRQTAPSARYRRGCDCGEPVHVPGGCAYNVSEILRQSGVPYTLFSPVGTGIYGNYVREHLKRKQIPILTPRACGR